MSKFYTDINLLENEVINALLYSFAPKTQAYIDALTLTNGTLIFSSSGNALELKQGNVLYKVLTAKEIDNNSIVIGNNITGVLSVNINGNTLISSVSPIDELLIYDVSEARFKKVQVAQLGAGGGGGSATIWGSITGTITDQTDLVAYLSTTYAPILHSHTISDITDFPTDISFFANDAGYLTSFTETDPIFTASVAAGITAIDISNWNDAYGWGNHASAGYVTSSPNGTANRFSYFTSADNLTSLNNFVANANIVRFTNDLNGVVTTTGISLFKEGQILLSNTGGVSFPRYNLNTPLGSAYLGYNNSSPLTGQAITLYSSGELILDSNNTTSLLSAEINIGSVSSTPVNVLNAFTSLQIYFTSPTINFFSQNDFYVSASSYLLLSSFDIEFAWSGILSLNGANITSIKNTGILGTVNTIIPTENVIKSYVDSAVSGAGYVPTSRTLTINGVAQDLSANRTWNVGTVTGTGTANLFPIFTGSSSIGNSYLGYEDVSTTQNRYRFNRSKFASLSDASSELILEGRYVNTNVSARILVGGANSFMEFIGNNAPMIVNTNGLIVSRTTNPTADAGMYIRVNPSASLSYTNFREKVAIGTTTNTMTYTPTKDLEVLGSLGVYFADDVEINGNLYLGATPGLRRFYVNGDSQFTDDLFLNAGAVIVQTAKKQTHTISGATFYSGGGDDGGAFTGDYSMWFGDEAAIGFTQIGAYPVNTGYGYGVFNGSKLANAAAFGAGAARGVVDMYAGGFTLTPTSAASAMTAMGAQSFRNVNWINNSTAVGFFAGSRFNNVFRSVFVGENAGSTDIDTKVRNAKRVVAVGTSALYGTTSANNSHTDVISIGFESGLFSGLTKSILLGTYAGHRAAGTGGLVASNVIHIGHAESSDLPISYGSNLSNVIVIGNDIVPVAANTIIFPTAYSMGVGTLNPQRKLHVEGDMRLTTLVSTPTKILGVDANGNVGEVLVGTNLTLTGGTLNAAGGGGGSTFLSLSDTPANYTGAGGFLLRVNAGATAVEFVNGTSLFAATSHTHAAGDITSGTFADARIALSNVSQHQASLSIGWGQLTGVPATFAPSAHTLDSHSNVTITANTNGEILKWNGSAWINNTLAEAGIQPAGSYALQATAINTQHSLTGGGDLSASRTLSFVGDVASPGNRKMYGTNASGTRGWYDQGWTGGSTLDTSILYLSNSAVMDWYFDASLLYVNHNEAAWIQFQESVTYYFYATSIAQFYGYGGMQFNAEAGGLTLLTNSNTASSKIVLLSQVSTLPDAIQIEATSGGINITANDEIAINTSTALSISGIPSATKANVLYYDTVNGQISYGALSGGGITTNQTRAVVTFKVISDTTVTTGEKTATRVVVPYSGTIVGWYIVTNTNTTATLDVWKVNAGIPAGGNTITASAKPTITAASYASSTTLTGWTTSVAQGDVMVLEVESNTAAAEIGLFLLIEKN